MAATLDPATVPYMSTPGVAPPAALEAFFDQRSAAAGSSATLTITGVRSTVSVQLYVSGPAEDRTAPADVMLGVPVGRPVAVASAATSATAAVPLAPDLPSGVYFARVLSSDGSVAYAPLVVHPRRLGASRVAVVISTDTWQAYNYRDDDADGVADTWYATTRIAPACMTSALHSPDVNDGCRVLLRRPYLNRGVPPGFNTYDTGFLRWLWVHAKRPDVLADDDLQTLTSRDLARRYDLIIFPEHAEYITQAAYNAIAGYRDLGGNLAFLSANNFYRRVDRHGASIELIRLWRNLKRPESALIGVQYVDWSHGHFANRPLRVTHTNAAAWLFRGTGLHNGSVFGQFGIEVDATSRFSPPGTHVLASIPNIFGPGVTAQMTYYQTARGAKVFAAGVFNFGASALRPITSIMLENLWRRLSRP